MKIKGMVVVAALLGCFFTVSAEEIQDNSSRSENLNIGSGVPFSVQSVQEDASGVTLKLQSGLLRLEVCDERTIHVTCTPADKLPEQEKFVVNRKWTPVGFEWQEQPESLVLRTPLIGVEISRKTGVLTFTDAEGKTLLQESSDRARTIESATSDSANQDRIYRVQQTFLSPNDEYLYGLAQCQNGIWNWRGMPIELRQVNTQAALPVLVSSRGYGLLWNNASLTDFNPIDQEIQLSGSDTTPDGGPTATEQLRGRDRGPRRGSSERVGTFTTGEAGEYVFFVKDGNRRNEIGIVVNDQAISRIQNMWVPYTTVGTIILPANSTCTVKVLGGGRNARIFARPLGNTTTFRSQAANSIDYYFFYGLEFDDIIAAYRNATGAAPLWPKWAYGFWQCRERYSSQQQILDTVAEFRQRRIPIDLIVQDWQYWGPHGWGAYEWDTSQYPDPEKMIQSLHEKDVKFMISVWSNPQGKAGDAFKSEGYTIPGTDWVDQTNPAARQLRWKYLNDAFFKIGTDAWWQDATEPGDDGNAMAGHRVFIGSGDLYRNIYPLFANQTVYEGQRKTNPEKRVCILTRSAFPGQQRYATALWSGDVGGNWDALRRQIPAGLHVCLTGLPYWTTDCGGFFRPRDQYQSNDFADLLIRWFQYSTFCPVQRIHGYQSETEFWKFPKAQETMVEYDRFRYRLLPYIYSIAWKVTNNDYTIMRALPMDFRSDPKVYDISDQYMFGPAFLVNPVTEPKAVSRSIYLPATTTWTNFWTGESSNGGQRADVAAPQKIIPLFVPAGSIIPLGPDLQYTDEKPAEPIELRIYTGANGSFTLYEDEGDSYNYEKGIFATIPIQWNEANQTLTIGERKGEFPGMLKERTFHIVWVSVGHGVGISPAGQPDAVVTYNGDAVKVSRSKPASNQDKRI
jgi:alpha-D-xyloside xylohydrolase